MANHLLCLECADVFAPSDGANSSCPSCGAVHDPERYDRLTRLASDVTHFGYQYRERYEQDAADGTERRRYFLPNPHDVLVFAALAVLSGILGNASWELIKAAAKRAAHRYTILSKHADPRVPAIDDALLERLNQHCRNFVQGLSGMEPEVRAAVVEEMIVHTMTEYLMNNPAAQAQMSGISCFEDFAAVLPELVTRATAERATKPKPTPEDFQDLWRELDQVDLLLADAEPTDV